MNLENEEEGFIVDDGEKEKEHYPSHSHEKQKKLKREKKKKKFVLDEDDYALLEENKKFHPKKFKRLKKASLFGDDEAPLWEDIGEEDMDLGEDVNEMAAFIVDEEKTNEHGAHVRNNFCQENGVSSHALQEAIDTFHPGEYQRKLHNNRKQESEHNELEASDDEEIQNIGIPISEDETKWIYDQLMIAPMPLLDKGIEEAAIHEAILNDITQFLDLRNNHKLEVPFIAMYRKEAIPTLLQYTEQQERNYDNQDDNRQSKMRWHKLLWAIDSLDGKWMLIQKWKAVREGSYKKRFEKEQQQKDLDIERINLIKKVFNALGTAESIKEIDDVDESFNLHFPLEESDNGQRKPPKRTSTRYSIARKLGLWMVSSKFGCISENFGQKICMMNPEALEDPRETPEEIASNFISTNSGSTFRTPQDVLNDARYMASIEIKCQPCVNKHVRSIFMDKAVVSTTPTPKGNVSIDAFHQFAGVKCLRNKPLHKFNDTQWLLIEKAVDEKLLQVTIKLPQYDLDKLVSDARNDYLSGGVSRSAQQWNEQRKQILDDAIYNHLLPSMEKEAKSLLATRAKNLVLSDYGRVLWEKVSVAPYQRKENDVSNDGKAAPRVMACCWEPGKSATTCVMLDSYGEMLGDVLYTGSLSLRSQNKETYKKDAQRLLEFINLHNPKIVVVGAVGAVNCTNTHLKEDISKILNPRDGLLTPVVYGDESLPRLYEHSHISNHQLPRQLGIVKRAVALGRYLQNPLAVVATVCGQEREILSWKLTPSDSFLNPDEKYEMIEQIMFDATNQVGLDVNLAASHEWLFAPLQFISGLGRWKAESLQSSLVKAKGILNRTQLRKEHGLKNKVFENAVGFLRVRQSGLAASRGQCIDLLDDTRIHPESYTLAQEVAKKVYKHDVQDDLNDGEDVLKVAIEHVRERPHLVKSFDVEAHARDINRENQIQTLNDIKMELINGFRDYRTLYREPSIKDEFYLFTGESRDTLSVGRIIKVKVQTVQSYRAICMLDSGLTGILYKKDYDDGMKRKRKRKRGRVFKKVINKYDILTCKVKAIRFEKYDVVLTYHSHEDKSSLRDKARKGKEPAKIQHRSIVHHRFQNIPADEAMKFLANKDPGESIIHPSSLGHTYLTLTLKVYEDVYAHIDIFENGKLNAKDFISICLIGKPLKIGNDTFEDLDEVMEKYVDPLVIHLKAMLSYPKFKAGTKSEVDNILKIEKADDPMRIVYCFGICHERPETFILTYMWKTTLHRERIGLYPKGFEFRKKMFVDLDSLVAYFQTVIVESAPSIRSVDAMVPMQSLAPGSAAGSDWGGTGNDGGWGGQYCESQRWTTPSSRMGRSDNRNGGSCDGLPPPYARVGQGRLPPRHGGVGRGRGRGRGGGRGRGT